MFSKCNFMEFANAQKVRKSYEPIWLIYTR